MFDTNALSIILYDNIPEKWSMKWKFIREGRAELILIEPLISEVFYKNVPKKGKKVSKNKIFWLKSLKKGEIYRMEDNDAILAGEIKIKYSNKGISLVDCFLIAVGKRQSASLFTTDPGIRDVARKLNVKVDYIPFPIP
jgi:predicted nucleic acid-binding protein